MTESRRSERLTAVLHGVFQSLIAAALGGGLLPGVKIVWGYFFHRPLVDWLQGPIANAFAALVLIPTFWVLTRPFSRLGTLGSRGKTPRASGDRVAIYVARFGNDEESAMARERVIASIRAELGPERIEVLPASILLQITDGVSDDFATVDARKKARLLLRKKNGDLLIWGRLYAMYGTKPRIDLRFVSADHDHFRTETFGFTEKLMIDADFGVEMGVALSAVAGSLAVPAVEDIGEYVARTLVPAAKRLEPLARNIPVSMREEDRLALLGAYGLIQLAIAEQSGESNRLREAIEGFREAIGSAKAKRAPQDCARMQNHLAVAQQTLGELENETDRLEEAVASYRRALRGWTRNRAPLYWAMVQNNLGNAFSSIGGRESGTARLDEALAAFRAALQEWSRDEVPLCWAMAQSNLGNVLLKLAERESGKERLEDAVAAYNAALQEWSRNEVPLYWAMAQSNLAGALMKLGERGGGIACLKKAVTSCNKALKVFTRDRAPMHWATTEDTLGNVLSILGHMSGRKAFLNMAIKAFRNALQERTRERSPLYWASTQNNLGNALSGLGERESGSRRLEEAATAFRDALQERTRDRVPLDWAVTCFNLGGVLLTLGARARGTETLEEAASAYRDALEVLTADMAPQYLVKAKQGLVRANELIESRNLQCS